ncbi:MAG: hypothetical protein Q7R83_04500 [bacterium]|nr:hypothetical protein [bacterium]
MATVDPKNLARPTPAMLPTKKKRFPLWATFGIWIAALLIVAAIPYYYLLKSGLLVLPGSSWLYHPPAPLRVLKTNAVLSSADLSKRIQYELAASVQKNPRASHHTVVLSEEELSASLVGAAVPLLQKQGMQVRALQLLSEPGGIQLYARLIKGALHIDFVIDARVDLEKQHVRFYPTGIRLGEWQISTATFDWLMREFVGYDTSVLSFSVANLPLEDIRFYAKAVQLDVVLKQAP